jgi:hypothetical protein
MHNGATKLPGELVDKSYAGHLLLVSQIQFFQSQREVVHHQ